MLGRDGQMISVNFLGQVVNRRQLFKPHAETKFELLNDVFLGTTFNILQVSNTQASILDSVGEEIFSLEIPSDNFEVEFYNFRNGREIYTVRDVENKTLTILNKKGLPLSKSMECDQRASILFYQNTQEYQVFVNFANQLTQYSIDAL